MNQEIFKKFSENLKKVLILSEKIAKDQNSITNTEHLLMALLSAKDSLAVEILTSFNITEERVQLISALISKTNQINTTQTGLSNDAKKAIQETVKIASKYNHYSVDCEHLLLALAQNKNYNSYIVLERIGVSPQEIIKQIEFIFGNSQNIKNNNISNEENETSPFFDEQGENEVFGMGMPGINPVATKTKRESILEAFTVNMSKLALSNKLDPVIGREVETLRLVQVLSRRTKNNPILVGEPGVGKTSIVEGLAQRIAEGKAPSSLAGKEILSLDMGSLIAGTMYRGQFESRVKKIIAEIRKRGNFILFIDEIHTVVGAGSTEGSIDAANLLKPLLAKGELRLIGSTTFDEYKKHIEKDPAFERRFQPIKISEPTAEESIKILNGIKSKYEEHHHVTYTEEAIEAAVYLAKRYINDRYLPDKAIDLIDEAAAATNTTVNKTATKLARYKKELHKVLKQKEELIIAENYKEATLLRKREIILQNQISKLRAEEIEQKKHEITGEEIADLVSKTTGVPVTNMSLFEKKKILNLENRIKKKIVGQDEAIKEIAKAIKRARVGIANPNRPTGSFIFLGPTGVGKSELAKVIAEEILGNKNGLIKIDMSEFMERHNVSRLIGAPAGYVGYEEGGKLTEIVRKNPYSIILLDEIEKANPEVFNILLQVMEDGELTDARGRKVDFKNTIIIMTSNLGTEILNKQASIGFLPANDFDVQYQKLEQNVLEAVEKHFKPEFLNRLDKIIVFRPLNPESIKKIVKLELNKLEDRLTAQKYNLKVSDQTIDWIAKEGFNPNFGARPIRKVISDHIENQISDLILKEELQKEATILVDFKNKKISVSVIS